MLFLVSLANQGVPDGAYLLSKLYSRGIVRPASDGAPPTVLLSANVVKAAVWSTVAINLARKGNKTAAQIAYFDGKLQRRMEKLSEQSVPIERFEREKALLKRKSP